MLQSKAVALCRRLWPVLTALAVGAGGSQLVAPEASRVAEDVAQLKTSVAVLQTQVQTVREDVRWLRDRAEEK